MTPAEASAYAARWREVEAVQRRELATMPLEAKVARFASLWAWRRVVPVIPGRRDDSVAVRWNRIRTFYGA